MPKRTPSSIRRLSREQVPGMLAAASGKRVLEDVAAIVETDRWNSFDHFHETTKTVERRFREAGAGVEIEPVQTGGRIGTGRWIIQQAADVRGATVDVMWPVRQRLLDYRENPWHVIQWSAGTPREGLRCRLVVLDSNEELERLPRDGLVGCAVLTPLNVREMLPKLADRGAAAVLAETNVPNNPDAVGWTKFGWGAISMRHATARLAGFALSRNQGNQLRALAAKHSGLKLRLKADVPKYVGTHDVISGIVRGAADPQDEVWAIAHSAEPGAIDNASGVALTVEIVRILEQLIQAGQLERPKRTIRLLSAYECYGFFAYLERQRRQQTPLAGVCIDSVGARPEVCGDRLEWHASIPMSAGFAERIGASVLRSTLRRHRPGYRLCQERFVSTADTLIGDPQYGFPCPWITTHHQGPGRGFDAYHSSADTLSLLSETGLEACAASVAAYLYYLADMGTEEVGEVAEWETAHVLSQLAGKKLSTAEARYADTSHRASMQRLQRWLWGGSREAILDRLEEAREQVTRACDRADRDTRRKRRIPAGVRRVPRRTAPLSPTMENTPPAIADRINGTGAKPWALFWADGKRNIADIADLAACESTASVNQNPTLPGKQVELEQFGEYFQAHAELGYCELIEPASMVSRTQLVRDLRALGLEPGMDVMVHSSLSAIGYVQGGADTVVDALLQAIGKRGTLLMPSFNHRAAQVYNPLTTPTTNGAIPDIMWRRREAVRSDHPTHAVAAIGPRAADYCRDHAAAGIWAQDSPIGRLIHGGGYILALGTDHNTSTAYHVAEISVPCRCIDMFANTDYAVQPDGEVRPVPGLAFRDGVCPVPTSKLDETLDRRGQQRHGKVGQADAGLVLARDLWQARREHIRRVCPTCPVRPKIRRD